MVSPVVAEGQLERRRPERKPQDLVAEADPEDGNPTKETAHGLDRA